MSFEVLEALGRITREKSIEKEELIRMIEAGILAAARKKFGTTENISVQVNPDKGNISVLIGKKVVESVTNPEAEISLVEARVFDPQVEIGEQVSVPVDFSEFGRTAIQAAKQVMIQRVREAEREKVHEEYSGKVGEIIHGTVQQIERGNYIVYISKQIEAVIPIREQNKKERFRQGDPIIACLVEVNDTSKGPQLILSRTNTLFLRSLFQKEVPEIAQGLVEIKEISREPSSRSKVAVVSHDRNVDPVGACVGLKGSRVQSIVKEVGGERIDIVHWSDAPEEFVKRALSPATVLKAIPDFEKKSMTVIVANDQLSLAIGRSGQNVRLASKLTGWQIDLMTKDEFEGKKKKTEDEGKVLVDIADYDLTHIPGIGEKTAQKLREAGFTSLADLIDVAEADLLKIDGIGEKTAKKLKAIADGIARDMLAGERG
ncbi:MAG: transcription termination factor NusA, partial [Candidatus Glassbacteria bacterium RBG_16_58_8]